MEGVPRMPMLGIELKQNSFDYSALDWAGMPTEDIHEATRQQIVDGLKKHIKEEYGDDPEKYNKAIEKLIEVQTAAYKAVLSPDFEGCNTLKKYYGQLHYMQSRFPFSGDDQIKVTFTWQDAFTGILTVHESFTFEQTAILFNTGAVHSLLGENDSRITEEGIRISCVHFQCAAGLFTYISDHFDTTLSPDISQAMLKLFINVMLAQGQECLLEKSMQDNRKHSIVSKISQQVVEFYKQSLQSLENRECENTLGSNAYKHWRRIVTFKAAYYSAITKYFMGNNALEQDKYGHAVAFYGAAVGSLNESVKLAKSIQKETRIKIDEALKFTSDVFNGKYNSSVKDNKFVYNEKVPDLSTLPEVKGASLVKPLLFEPANESLTGPDIFAKLVPMKAILAASTYSDEKDKLLRTVNETIEQKDEILKQYKQSIELNPTKLINYTETSKLDQALIEKCALLSVDQSPITQLKQAMEDLTEVYSDLDSILNDILTISEDEETEDIKLKDAAGEEAFSTQEDVDGIKKELTVYKEIYNKATQMNDDLHTACRIHINNMKLIAGGMDSLRDELNLTNIADLLSKEEKSDVELMRKLCDKVVEMEEQRQDLLRQLKQQLDTDDVTSTLVTKHGIDQEELFQEELKKHDSLVTTINQNLTAQDNILAAVTQANAKYAKIRKSVETERLRVDQKVSNLLLSTDVYEEVLNKCNEGKKFFLEVSNRAKQLYERAKEFQDENQEKRKAIYKKIEEREKAKRPPPRPSAPKPKLSSKRIPLGSKSLPTTIAPIASGMVLSPDILAKMMAEDDDELLNDPEFLQFLQNQGDLQTGGATLPPGSAPMHSMSGPGNFSSRPHTVPSQYPAVSSSQGFPGQPLGNMPSRPVPQLTPPQIGAPHLQSFPQHSYQQNFNVSSQPDPRQSPGLAYPMAHSPQPGHLSQPQFRQHSSTSASSEHTSWQHSQPTQAHQSVASMPQQMSPVPHQTMSQVPHQTMSPVPHQTMSPVPHQTMLPVPHQTMSQTDQFLPRTNPVSPHSMAHNMSSRLQSDQAMPRTYATVARSMTLSQVPQSMSPMPHHQAMSQSGGFIQPNNVATPYSMTSQVPQSMSPMQHFSMAPSQMPQNMSPIPHYQSTSQSGQVLPHTNVAVPLPMSQVPQSMSPMPHHSSISHTNLAMNAMPQSIGPPPQHVYHNYHSVQNTPAPPPVQVSQVAIVYPAPPCQQSASNTFTQPILAAALPRHMLPGAQYSQSDSALHMSNQHQNFGHMGNPGLSNPPVEMAQQQIGPGPYQNMQGGPSVSATGYQPPVQSYPVAATPPIMASQQLAQPQQLYRPGLNPPPTSIPQQPNTPQYQYSNQQNYQGQLRSTQSQPPIPNNTLVQPPLPHVSQSMPQQYGQYPTKQPQQRFQSGQVGQQQQQQQAGYGQAPFQPPTQSSPQNVQNYQQSSNFVSPRLSHPPAQQSSNTTGPFQGGQQALNTNQVGHPYPQGPTQQQLSQPTPYAGQNNSMPQNTGSQMHNQGNTPPNESRVPQGPMPQNQNINYQAQGVQQAPQSQYEGGQGFQQQRPSNVSTSMSQQAGTNAQSHIPAQMPQSHGNSANNVPNLGNSSSLSQAQTNVASQQSMQPQASVSMPQMQGMVSQNSATVTPQPLPSQYSANVAHQNPSQISATMSRQDGQPHVPVVTQPQQPGPTVTSQENSYTFKSHPHPGQYLSTPSNESSPKHAPAQRSRQTSLDASAHGSRQTSFDAPAQAPILMPISVNEPKPVVPPPKQPSSDLAGLILTPTRTLSSSADELLFTSPDQGSMPTRNTNQVVLVPTKIDEESDRMVVRPVEGLPYMDEADLMKFKGQVTEFRSKVGNLLNKPESNGLCELDREWKQLSETQEKHSRQLSTAIARCSSYKNRYQDIVPFDQSRVILKNSKDDYINASVIDGVSQYSPRFIATQSPLANTTSDFWLMVYEQQVTLIVMLVNSKDVPKRCPMYWPANRTVPQQHGPLTVSFTTSKTRGDLYVERTFTIKHKNQSLAMSVTQLQYIAWPEHRLPSSASDLLSFLTVVQSYHSSQRNLQWPVLLHCESGVGRTGVFCAFLAGVTEINAGMGIINVIDIVTKMRQKRKYMIQEKAQLKFIYDVVLYHAIDVLKQRRVILEDDVKSMSLPQQTHQHPAAVPVQSSSQFDIFSDQSALSSIQANVEKMTIKPGLEKIQQSAISSKSCSDIPVFDNNPIQNTMGIRPNTTGIFSISSLDGHNGGMGGLSDLVQGTIIAPVQQEFPPAENECVPQMIVSKPDVVESCNTQVGYETQKYIPASNEIDPEKSNSPINLIESLTPETFTLTTEEDSNRKRRVTKEDFFRPNVGLSLEKDPTDPFSGLDPLWGLKK